MIEELDLGPIEERLAKAYPGPWVDDVDGDDGGLRVYREGHTYDAFHIWFGDMEETEGIDHHTAAFVSNARQDIPLLIAEVKRLRQDRAEVRRDALLEAAKENCLYCRHGDKPKFKMRWHHTDSNGVVFGVCQSDKIYRLLPADQGQGQGKE